MCFPNFRGVSRAKLDSHSLLRGSSPHSPAPLIKVGVERGFALVTVLILLALLSVVTVSFLSSTSMERATARAFVAEEQAELAAKAAVSQSIAVLKANLTQYPDSATTWEALTPLAGGFAPEGTMLYYTAHLPEPFTDKNGNGKCDSGEPFTDVDGNGMWTPQIFNPAGDVVKMLPLISGATAQLLTNKSSAVDPAMTATNSYDLNQARFAGDTSGWIGSPSPSPSPPPGPSPTPRPFRAPWVEITDPTSAKVIARYAYWVEDESFKLNVNQMGTLPRGKATLGVIPSDVPVQGMLKAVLSSTQTGYDAMASDIMSVRNVFPQAKLPDVRLLNQAFATQPSLGDVSKFEATLFSGAANTSRRGSSRLNLNAVVQTSTSAAAIRTQLDQIIAAINYHVPGFGQRFYRTDPPDPTKPFDPTQPAKLNTIQVPPAVSPPDIDRVPDPDVYLQKLAANIRDYIDADSQPTIVNNDGTDVLGKPFAGVHRDNDGRTGPTIRIGVPKVAIGVKGGFPSVVGSTKISGPNEVIAIGKENVPFFQEYVFRFKQISFTDTNTDEYKFSIDHYFEFWNLTERDITVADLGPNAFIRVTNQFGWGAAGGPRYTQPDISPTDDIPIDSRRDFSIPLASIPNLVFKAGQATVITTDPNVLPNGFSLNANLYRIPASAFPSPTPPGVATSPRSDYYRIYSGKVANKNGNGNGHAYGRKKLISDDRTGNGWDYQTGILLGNDVGVLESKWAGCPVAKISIKAKDFNDGDDIFYGGQLRGNDKKGNSSYQITPSQQGDPRANNEQLSPDITILSSDPRYPDQTRYVSSDLDTTNPPAKSTLTTANYYENPSLWPDTSNASAAVIANTPLASIGQLGQIYDAVRAIGPGGVSLSRGGGRTLRIGQPDRYDASQNTMGLWDGNSKSSSREWTSWRLCDIFSTQSDDLSTATIDESLNLPGRININGLRRDDGAAFKAALYGFIFGASPDSDPQLTGRSLSNTALNTLVSQAISRLKNEDKTPCFFANTLGPFAERGELSELPIFDYGTYLAPEPPPAINTATVFDRGREELFRRVVELITTRGNVFSVYAVGQAIQQTPDGTKLPVSTRQMKVTFQIDPQWTPALTATFDPSSSSAVTARFRKPDSYALKILQITN